jgi:hypothetical protein
LGPDKKIIKMEKVEEEKKDEVKTKEIKSKLKNFGI